MTDIDIQNIKKAFEEGNNILDRVTFNISAGERVGLLGKNGAGKTTLLKIITGELTEDEGNIIISPMKKLGLISQIPVYPDGFSVEDVLRSAFNRLLGIKSEMERLEEQLADGMQSAQILAEYDTHQHEFERLGGYTMETELNRVSNGLQIPRWQWGQRFNTLSGGERTRINLARLILENTDILLLDEPTNHLDLNATIWLEEFLRKFKGTVMVISHDRYFLDRTISRVVEINAGKAEFYSGNYSFYVEEKKRRYEEQLGRFEREYAESRRLHASADRLQQWGFGNSKLMKKSLAMRTRAQKALQTDKPSKDKEIRARFNELEFRGDEALLIKGLSKTYGGDELIRIDELLVQGKERIAIIGDNGTGKTTLVKIIMGEEKPDTGFARLGPSVKSAYLPQIIQFENPHRTILDTLVYDLGLSPQMARNRLGAYMFSSGDVFKDVGDLSGGEKSRLRLCMLMSADVNLLILDEPTNHLDLPSREWMEGALADFDETIIFISHDRYFINRFATRIWELSDGKLTDFHGDYTKYVNSRVDSKTASSSSASGSREKSQLKGGHKAASHPSKPIRLKEKPSERQKEIRHLEREISRLEKDLESVKLKKGIYSTDYEKLMELDDEERGISDMLEEVLEKWSGLQ